MGFSRFRNDCGGYATPAALVVSLAIALLSTAFVTRSGQLLRLSRLDLEQAQVELALAGAHLEAAAAIVRTDAAGPFHWVSSTELGAVDLRAEPEAEKLGLAAAARLSAASLTAFGVADPKELQVKLANAEREGDLVEIAGLDGARAWRDCAPRLVSWFGRASHYRFAPDTDPTETPRPPRWRIGEVWRIRAATGSGWRDERLVRFTGHAQRPAAIVARTFSRDDPQGEQCDTILSALVIE